MRRRTAKLPICARLRRTERLPNGSHWAGMTAGVRSWVVSVRCWGGMVEGGVFGGAGVRCVGRARDVRLLCMMVVDKVCRICSLDDRMTIWGIPIHIPCTMGDKGVLRKEQGDMREG